MAYIWQQLRSTLPKEEHIRCVANSGFHRATSMAIFDENQIKAYDEFKVTNIRPTDSGGDDYCISVIECFYDEERWRCNMQNRYSSQMHGNQ